MNLENIDNSNANLIATTALLALVFWASWVMARHDQSKSLPQLLLMLSGLTLVGFLLLIAINALVAGDVAAGLVCLVLAFVWFIQEASMMKEYMARRRHEETRKRRWSRDRLDERMRIK